MRGGRAEAVDGVDISSFVAAERENRGRRGFPSAQHRRRRRRGGGGVGGAGAGGGCCWAEGKVLLTAATGVTATNTGRSPGAAV